MMVNPNPAKSVAPTPSPTTDEENASSPPGNTGQAEPDALRLQPPPDNAAVALVRVLGDGIEEVRDELRNLYNALVLDFKTAPEWLVRNVAQVARESVDQSLNILRVPFEAWCNSQWSEMPPRLDVARAGAGAPSTPDDAHASCQAQQRALLAELRKRDADLAAIGPALEALIASWREQCSRSYANAFNAGIPALDRRQCLGVSQAYDQCADELAALLRSAREP